MLITMTNTQQNYELLDPASLTAMSSPIRQQLLEALGEPNSAAELARRYDMSRQRIGYHMRDLEKAGCIGVVGERQQRGLKEKLYQVTPRVYAQAPDADLAADQDRFSFARLLNVLGTAIKTLTVIRRQADAAGKRVATLALDAELHFESPAQRKAFTEDLLDAVEAVLRKHERPRSRKTRAFRLLLGAYPAASEAKPAIEK